MSHVESYRIALCGVMLSCFVLIYFKKDCTSSILRHLQTATLITSLKCLTKCTNFTFLGVAAISFLKPAEDTPSSAHFVTGTGHKHVRLYDIKASQQPSFSIDIGGEYRITSIQPTKDGNALFVGDCSGTVIYYTLLHCFFLYCTSTVSLH